MTRTRRLPGRSPRCDGARVHGIAPLSLERVFDCHRTPKHVGTTRVRPSLACVGTSAGIVRISGRWLTHRCGPALQKMVGDGTFLARLASTCGPTAFDGV
jgi:hypothetical protein